MEPKWILIFSYLGKIKKELVDKCKQLNKIEVKLKFEMNKENTMKQLYFRAQLKSIRSAILNLLKEILLVNKINWFIYQISDFCVFDYKYWKGYFSR